MAMRRIILKTSAIVIAIAIGTSTSWADNQRDTRGGSRNQSQTAQQSAGQRRGAGQQAQPASRGGQRNSPTQSAQQKTQNRQNIQKQPSSVTTPGQRPGAGQQLTNSNRPQNANQSKQQAQPAQPRQQSPAHRPTTPHRPVQPAPAVRRDVKPAPRPNYNAFRPHIPVKPFYVHAVRPIPVRPTSWAYVSRPISFGQALLGLTLGAAFNISLDFLYNNGYTVGGYAADAIYLNNVNMMNFMWPEASMFYNAGRLVSTVYTYSSPYDNASRYNVILDRLTAGYGAPYITPTASGMSSTWWNSDGSYVTLSYESVYNAYGRLGYHTTLTFGR